MILGATAAKKKGVRRRLRDGARQIVKEIADQLSLSGSAVVDHFCSQGRMREVLSELAELQPHYTASEIWVGAEAGLGAQVRVPEVRGDKVLWMCGGHSHVAGVEDARDDVSTNPATNQSRRDDALVEPCDQNVRDAVATATKTRKAGVTKLSHNALMAARFRAVKTLVGAIEKLVLEYLSRESEDLKELSGRSDAMLALYPGEGSRFQKHVDNTAEDGRRITAVVYMNEQWREEHGGALRLFPAQGSDSDVVRDVMPEAGRLALFYSHLVPHEVRPSFAPRHALTLWFYDREEREKAMEKAAELRKTLYTAGESAQNRADFTVQDREAARAFATYLVENNEASPGEVATKAKMLSDGAKLVLAGMTGTPTGDHFVAALRRMTRDELSDLRGSFSRMGIK